MVSRALLLVDLQNDYFPGGAMELVGAVTAVLRAAELLAAIRRRGLPVVHVQHLANRPGATFFRPGTPGAEIHPAVVPLPGEPLIVKHYPNAFRETRLLETLQGLAVKELVIAGAMTHMCIDATTRAAFDFGFGCRVAADACATRDLRHDGRVVVAADVQAAFLAALATPYATISGSAEIAALLA